MEVEEEKIEAVAEPLTNEEEVVVEPVAEPAPKEEERVIPTVEVEEEKIEAVAEPFVKAEEEEVKSVLEPPVKEEHVEPVAVPVGEAEEAVEKVHEPMLVEEEKPTELDIQPQEPQEVTTVSVPFESLDKPMSRLLGIKTVKGAFICSNDGLLIQDYCKARADTEEMCAMIAAIYNEAEQSFKFLKEGGVEKFIIEKGDETICVITAGESLLTVITHPETKAGLVFVYARKIIDEIREILG